MGEPPKKHIARRHRCNDAVVVRQALEELVTKKKFLRYGNRLEAEPLDRPAMENAADILRAIRSKISNFSVVKAAVEKALGEIGDEKNKEWKWTEEELDEWKSENAKRVRTLCLQAAAVARRKPQPEWFLRMFEERQKEKEEKEQETEGEGGEGSGPPQPQTPWDGMARDRPKTYDLQDLGIEGGEEKEEEEKEEEGEDEEEEEEEEDEEDEEDEEEEGEEEKEEEEKEQEAEDRKGKEQEAQQKEAEDQEDKGGQGVRKCKKVTEWIVGVDESAGIAYRVPADNRKKEPEVSMPLKLDVKAKPTDPVVAKWPDGYTYELQHLPQARLQDLKSGKKRGTYGKGKPLTVRN